MKRMVLILVTVVGLLAVSVAPAFADDPLPAVADPSGFADFLGSLGVCGK